MGRDTLETVAPLPPGIMTHLSIVSIHKGRRYSKSSHIIKIPDVVMVSLSLGLMIFIKGVIAIVVAYHHPPPYSYN